MSCVWTSPYVLFFFTTVGQTFGSDECLASCARRRAWGSHCETTVVCLQRSKNLDVLANCSRQCATEGWKKPFSVSVTVTCRQRGRWDGTGRCIFALVMEDTLKITQIKYSEVWSMKMCHEIIGADFKFHDFKKIELLNEFLHKALIAERIDVLSDNPWPQYTNGMHVSRACLLRHFPEIVCYKHTNRRTPNATENCISRWHILWYARSLLWLPQLQI